MTTVSGSKTSLPERTEVQKPQSSGSSGRSKKIWIDLDNSPHVPFFVPIIAELERQGYEIVITARAAFQVNELAELFQLRYKSVGQHWGKNRLMKVCGTLTRAAQLLPIVVKEKPALAIAHGSRSMCVASWLMQVPYLQICDYEFARFLPGVNPAWLLIPEVIPDSSIPIKKDRILRYSGIKEDIYAPTFQPDESVREELGLRKEDIVVALRPPADQAHYHRPESDELFGAAVQYLGEFPNTKMVLLPRIPAQGHRFQTQWPELFSNGKIIIPKRVLNGLNLVWFSDLVISGGGTMNREAAALGVPVYSVFRGRIGAVDQYLSSDGRLTLLESVEDVRTKISVTHRDRPVMPAARKREALRNIVDHVVTIMETKLRSK